MVLPSKRRDPCLRRSSQLFPRRRLTNRRGRDDVEELLRLVSEVRGFPSHASTDVYGLDAKLELNTFDIQWSNAETDPTSDAISEVAPETKDSFRRVVESIEAASRQFAKQDKAI
jgi:hypothetical protein